MYSARGAQRVLRYELLGRRGVTGLLHRCEGVVVHLTTGSWTQKVQLIWFLQMGPELQHKNIGPALGSGSAGLRDSGAQAKLQPSE